VRVHSAKLLITASFVMMLSICLIIGSLWISFGLVFETTAEARGAFEIIMTSASIVWSAISLIILLYFVRQVRGIMKRARHEGKT